MSEFLGHLDAWSTVWSECLWRASVQGGIAVAVTWAVCRSCRFLSARVQCWVWRLACLKMLVALVWSQPFDLPILPAPPPQLAAQATPAPLEHSSQSHQLLPTAAAIPPIVRQFDGDESALSLSTVLFLLWGIGVA